MTYTPDDIRDAEWDYDGEPDPAAGERPVVDATYLLRLPEGQVVEVVVLEVEAGRVTFRSVGSGNRPRFTYPVDQFMGMAI